MASPPCNNHITHSPEPSLPPAVPGQRKKSNKPHVRTACSNCKKAHLACDTERPCKRCVSVGKADSCYDIQHKKRGRPKLRPPFPSGATSLSMASLPVNSIHTPASPYYHHPHRPSGIPTTSASRHPLVMPMPMASAASGATNSTPKTAPIPLTRPSATSLPTLAPFLPPSPPASSFSMTKQLATEMEPSPMQRTVLTMFLTLDMLCARTSDECVELLGYHPQDLAYKPLEQFLLNPSELRQVHQQLTQSYQQCVSSQPPAGTTLPGSSEHFQSSPATLLEIANGSRTFKTRLVFKTAAMSHDTAGNGIDQHQSAMVSVMDAQFYFGGGLGADLCSLSNLDRLYIVGLLTLSKSYVSYQQPRVSRQLSATPAVSSSGTPASNADFLANFPSAPSPIMLTPNTTANMVMTPAPVTSAPLDAPPVQTADAMFIDSMQMPYFSQVHPLMPPSSSISTYASTAPSLDISMSSPSASSSASPSPPPSNSMNDVPVTTSQALSPIIMSLPYGNTQPSNMATHHQDSDTLLSWLTDSFPQQVATAK
ncbi:hypothetical protein BC940DRAFT_368759 [Gongronella butleri]|nr:hypothetical protein BC940DRAFT_368759 [Gongronella butleri]